MSVPIVEQVSAVSLWLGVSNMSVLGPLWIVVSVSVVQHVSALTTADWCIKYISDLYSVDGCVCISGATCQ